MVPGFRCVVGYAHYHAQHLDITIMQEDFGHRCIFGP